MEIAFVGALIPNATVEEYPALSAAGMMFQERLVTSLAGAGLRTSCVLSYPPVPSYPRARKLWLPRRRLEGWSAEVVVLPCVNVGPLKTATLGLALLPLLLHWCWSRRHGARAILLYNVASPPAFVSLFAARLTRTPAFAVVADLEVPGAGHLPDTWMRRVDYALQTRSLKHFDGLIVLTRAIALDFAPRTRWIQIEGAVPEGFTAKLDGDGSPAGRDGGEVVIMYSGGLTWLKGVPWLLEAFALVDDPRLRLWMTGRGECETLVEAAAQRDPRIVYHGFIDYEEVLALYRRADILVNPHLATPLSARYLFPSKLLEYLATGRPVVALSTPDIAAGYGDAIVVVEEETPAALADGLRRAAAMTCEERRALGARGRAAVAGKTWPEQARRIATFVEQCALGSTAAG